MDKFPHILVLNNESDEDSEDSDGGTQKLTPSISKSKTVRANSIMSAWTPSLIPDEVVLGQLLRAKEKDAETQSKLDAVNNQTLRKYFLCLTARFLEPFASYFQFSVPSGEWNPYLNPPSLKPFEKDSFLATIREIPKSFLDALPLRMSSLPNGRRSILVKMYAQFLMSPHFPSWFNKKRERAKRKCTRIVQKMIAKVSFSRMVEGKPVREGITMYQTIHRHLDANNQSARPKADLNDTLIRHRAVLRSALPAQIIEALDAQVEKMRAQQIEKRKEWQTKYRMHLKQQREAYNLDDGQHKSQREKERDRAKERESKEQEEDEDVSKVQVNDSMTSLASLTSASSVLTSPSYPNGNGPGPPKYSESSADSQSLFGSSQSEKRQNGNLKH